MTFFFPGGDDLEEMKKVPAFTRICIEDSSADKGYALIVKANTTDLSYLMAKNDFTFVIVFVEPENTLAYFVEIQDGYGNPACPWSAIASETDIQGIFGLERHELNSVYLFNELESCVAYGQVFNIESSKSNLSSILRTNLFYKDRFEVDNVEKYKNYIEKVDNYDLQSATYKIHISWTGNLISYVADDLSVKDLSIYTQIGLRQEGIVQMLSDGLFGCSVKSSLCSVNDPTNEITDIFVNTGKCAVLLESKELNVVSEELVCGQKTEKRITRSIRKATKQLRDGLNYIYNHSQAYDWKKNKVDLGNWERAWAIIVISDVRRIPIRHNDIISELEIFEKETETIIDIIDTNLLFRAVQFAHIIAEESNDPSIGDHFVSWLLQRRLLVDRYRSLRFDMLYKGDGMFEANMYS